LVDGAELILANERFIKAAKELFATDGVTPTTIVVNVNGPMPSGAVHLDIPSFRGATRQRYPLPLLQAMGTSGLFEAWRVIEAGAVTWFYEGPGGTYDYWPDGLDGPMRQESPPFSNTALVADNDRIYHRIGRVGLPSDSPAVYPVTSCIVHDDADRWSIVDGDRELARYPDQQIRLSILWKAQVDPAGANDVPPLEPALVASMLSNDLGARGVDVSIPVSPLDDHSWISLVHEVYYPPITVE
jgi:hypothetical protein